MADMRTRVRDLRAMYAELREERQRSGRKEPDTLELSTGKQLHSETVKLVEYFTEPAGGRLKLPPLVRVD